jgi:hypothetical protein
MIAANCPRRYAKIHNLQIGLQLLNTPLRTHPGDVSDAATSDRSCVAP